jgi:hypothetical protein
VSKKRLQSACGVPFLGPLLSLGRFSTTSSCLWSFPRGGYQEKIWYASGILFHGVSHWSLFGFPALIAILTTFAMPLLNMAAELWFQTVEVLTANLKLWLDTGRRHSDPKLRSLARMSGIERDSIRHYAKRLHKEGSIAAFELYQKQQPGISGMRVIKGLEGWPFNASAKSDIWGASADLKAELFPVIESVGFPVLGLKMLALMQVEGELSEERLLRDSPGVSGQLSFTRTLAILCGAALVDVIWEVGVMPTYRLNGNGHFLLAGVRELAPEAFH